MSLKNSSLQHIPCIVFAYKNQEAIRATIACLTKEPRLELHVVENRSQETPHIADYLTDCLQKKTIASYMQTEENITNNALELSLIEHRKRLLDSQYLMITDADLVATNEHWLDEQLHILESQRDLFACGIRLSTGNLPLERIPEAKDWIPKNSIVHTDYIEQLCGLHFLLVRTADFKNLLQHLSRRRQAFLDSHLHQWARKSGKRWAITRHAEAIHLTWDEYSDPQSTYLEEKMARGKKLWNHNHYCNYYLFSNEGKKYVNTHPLLKRLITITRLLS